MKDEDLQQAKEEAKNDTALDGAENAADWPVTLVRGLEEKTGWEEYLDFLSPEGLKKKRQGFVEQDIKYVKNCGMSGLTDFQIRQASEYMDQVDAGNKELLSRVNLYENLDGACMPEVVDRFIAAGGDLFDSDQHWNSSPGYDGTTSMILFHSTTYSGVPKNFLLLL